MYTTAKLLDFTLPSNSVTKHGKDFKTRPNRLQKRYQSTATYSHCIKHTAPKTEPLTLAPPNSNSNLKHDHNQL
ncbi:hypothetical protein KC19_11G051800 [Ceratodon purpureus]|uniref:Uncharacterized protein n=1 Tax=Ceratodon purpureus TaxID=3225 RepID=A0A8T0GCF8_CERPU|nr:hypothetical protein KC19_11G051800 [Ceratodon purpureus]